MLVVCMIFILFHIFDYIWRCFLVAPVLNRHRILDIFGFPLLLHFPWIISRTQYIFPNQLLFRDIKIKLHIIERKSQQPISKAVGNCSHKPKQRLNIGPIFASDNTTFPSSPTLISLKIDTFSISFTGKMGQSIPEWTK